MLLRPLALSAMHLVSLVLEKLESGLIATSAAKRISKKRGIIFDLRGLAYRDSLMENRMFSA